MLQKLDFFPERKVKRKKSKKGESVVLTKKGKVV